jgi:chromatin remodeling complex protein RSC6
MTKNNEFFESTIFELRKNFYKQKKLMKKLESLKENCSDNSSDSNELYEFNKMIRVPDSLKDLLELDKDELSQIQIMKKLHQYFSDNEMYDKKNRYLIIPNKKIRKIFGMEKTDEMNLLNLQEWISKIC